MNPEQRKMARSALGLVDGRKQSYRNRFVIYTNQEMLAQWGDMVAKGLAVEQGPIITKDKDGKEVIINQDMHFFWLTEKGARLALDPGESLDPEDFPPT